MKKIAVIIVIILVLASIAVIFSVLKNRYNQSEPAPPSDQKTIYLFGPGDHDFSLDHDVLIRVYSVHVPPSYDPGVSTPVIIVMHGGGGNVRSMRSWTLLDQASDKEGFIVVYPEGTGPKVADKTVGSWNAGRCCPEAMYKNIDDVGFISSMIEQLKKDFNVDPRRIFATGHSNGAQMSFRLACEMSDKIAAIAPSGAQGVFDDCRPERSVPVMYFHGTVDPCSPYDGGKAGGCFDQYLNDLLGIERQPYIWDTDSVPQYIEKWRDINGVSGTSQVVYRKGNATCESWGKSTPEEVVLCTIKTMGHTWPSGTYGQPCVDSYESRNCRAFRNAVGALTGDISANDQMWEFFKRHPLPEATSLSATAGDYDFSLKHDGLVRTYKVHVPSSYDGKKPTSIVLNFHGGYGNAEAAERQTEMSKTSDKEGFILVYPEAVIGSISPSGMRYQHWNGGPRVESNKSEEVDDIGFVSALLDKLEKDFNIDSRRIYATGISNGGTMVYRLACQLSDRIAAVAPIETNQLNIDCNPARPVSIMHFHGLSDRFVPFKGGVGPELPDDWKPVETTISEWVGRNGCPAIAQVTYKKGGAICRTYGPCKDNTEVTLCTIEEHGHTWPGGPDNADGAKVCQSNPDGLLCKKMREYFGPVSQDISANDAMWEFFKRHPMR